VEDVAVAAVVVLGGEDVALGGEGGGAEVLLAQVVLDLAHARDVADGGRRRRRGSWSVVTRSEAVDGVAGGLVPGG
jgi:hypothetical protein